jgi:hypothetical protein
MLRFEGGHFRLQLAGLRRQLCQLLLQGLDLFLLRFDPPGELVLPKPTLSHRLTLWRILLPLSVHWAALRTGRVVMAALLLWERFRQNAPRAVWVVLTAALLAIGIEALIDRTEG